VQRASPEHEIKANIWSHRLISFIKPGTWLLVIIFLLITFVQYSEHLGHPPFIAHLTANLGLTRYTVERILYLVPIIWASILFGWRGGAIVSIAALASMLPRAIFESPRPEDAIVETMAIFIVGNLAGFSLESLKRERERRSEVEAAQTELKSKLVVIEENEKKLAALNKTSAIVSQSLQFGEVLDNAVVCVMDVIAVEVVLLYLINEEENKLVLAAHRGVSPEFAESVSKISVGEGFNGRVAKSGEALFVEDMLIIDSPTMDSVQKENIRSQFIVPLRSKGKVVGTLCVAMHSKRRFLSEEADLLTAIGNQIGVAVENARLYQQERGVSQQLKTSEQRYRELFENAHDAIWLHDLNGKIVTANKACTRLTGYSLAELHTLQIADLLSEDSLKATQKAEKHLIDGESGGSLAEVILNKKDGSKAVLQLAISSLANDGNYPSGFQFIARDMTSEKQMQENLRSLLRQVAKAQEEERKRIAQELHDDTVQELVVLCQRIDDLAASEKGLGKQAKLRLGKLHQEANYIMQEARRLSQDLRPAVLDNLGLVPALKWLGSDLLRYSEISVDVKVQGSVKKLPDEEELVLFRIAQEALRNISKHAQASSAEITIEFADTKTRITIKDNGKGFVPPDDINDLLRYSKLGLAGMQERAQSIGGSLAVVSRPGEGTTLTAELPLLIGDNSNSIAGTNT